MFPSFAYRSRQRLSLLSFFFVIVTKTARWSNRCLRCTDSYSEAHNLNLLECWCWRTELEIYCRKDFLPSSYSSWILLQGVVLTLTLKSILPYLFFDKTHWCVVWWVSYAQYLDCSEQYMVEIARIMQDLPLWNHHMSYLHPNHDIILTIRSRYLFFMHQWNNSLKI